MKQNKKFNIFSIIGLLLSTIGYCMIIIILFADRVILISYSTQKYILFTSLILGLIFAIISFYKIKVSGENGKVFALIPIIITITFLILFIFAFIFGERGHPGGKNAAIKSQLASMKAQGELYFLNNESYVDICDSTNNGFGGVEGPGLLSVALSYSSKYKCFSDKDSWIVSLNPIYKDSPDHDLYYCVDSTGKFAEITNVQNDLIVNADTLCPLIFLSGNESKNEVPQIDNISQLENIIPENIENYTIDNNGIIGYKNRFSEEICDRNTNLKDEYCYKELHVSYLNTTNNKVIFVILNIVTKNLDSYEERLKRLFKKDVLNSFNILRSDIFDITWQPLSTYNLITVMEGKSVVNPDGSISYEYKEKASGANPVTQYFINKYSPIKL